MAKPHISGMPPHSAAATAHNRARWSIAFLLGFGVLINFFDRVNLSVAHDALRFTFHMDEVAFGYLAGAYNWTYAACQLPIGALLDAVGVAVVGRIGSLLWGVATTPRRHLAHVWHPLRLAHAPRHR